MLDKMGYYTQQNRKKAILKQHTLQNQTASCRYIPITDVLSSGAWKGKRCFIIGGGPSLERFDPKLLKNELTIGVNKAFIKYNSTINYGSDSSLHDKLCFHSNNGHPDWKETLDAWAGYKGLKVFLQTPKKRDYSDEVFVVKKLINKTVSFNLSEGIYGGSNSGFAALSLAVALGANPIYLLGYDMKIVQDPKTKDFRTHWHSGYANQPRGPFSRRIAKFVLVFDEFAPKFRELGIDIINLNPDSGLDCFPKDKIENVLR